MGDTGFIKGIVIVGIVIVLVSSLCNTEDDTKCIKVGCNNKCAPDNLYCYTHGSYSGSTYNRNSGYSKRNSSTYSYSKGKDTSYSTNKSTNEATNNSKPYSHKSTSKSKKYTENDPVDYDSPDDYADDAYGVDFDDWDEAYDYWEDY